VTKGDGQLDATDIIQTRRYAAGLDPVVTAGGNGERPTPTPTTPSANVIEDRDIETTRAVRMPSIGTDAGRSITLPIELAPNGDELAMSFTLSFDPTRLTNARVTLAEGLPAGTVLTINNTGDGLVGVLIDSTQALTVDSAPRAIVSVTFDVAANAPGGETEVRFTDTLASRSVAGLDGRSLTTRYVDGTVMINAPAQSGAEISGRVLDGQGRGIRNAVVQITDADGSSRTTTTGSFGHYTFASLEIGETYRITVRSTRHRFTPRTVEPSGNLTDIDFTGQE